MRRKKVFETLKIILNGILLFKLYIDVFKIFSRQSFTYYFIIECFHHHFDLAQISFSLYPTTIQCVAIIMWKIYSINFAIF